MMKALSYHGLKIIETADHEPPMNEVEGVVEEPFLLAVFAVEFHIRRCALDWLDEAYVCPYDICVWMLFGEFDGPYPRAGSNV